MTRIIINGSEMTSRERAHEYLKDMFGFPEYYGKNLDALCDLLNEKTVPVEIRLINSEDIVKLLGPYGNSLLDVFKDVSIENENIIVDIS
ncbi:ribonuclease inhibitor [Dethiosulfatibacter aminovorans DSM 17477]|uniref:Ribonuclease inhibitor n=1 Tax=Dethiosulfatibacter aminovorans DSM 17477 TaxID=1121476 RepID=A0A1M6JWI1_9FIRM|nr:barstar family protein [Dethiosulfatibacter aminovorans]SHJ51041.1 ribonuclease inhibitor [Dethiosulfatibacter aminovorans DSM 17477]